ncbi:hypothetical protein [Polyangium spumosum]|uniref:STAS domain-containing protein n=1 Tax=Polyangium spumosum TaxID=889282 RepID=A0A6N7PLZ0_9BACT|nr:hypothetical protein [Polyangium spumosum]MRG92797.1 hypothetical protein [Polyangium spumosum]
MAQHRFQFTTTPPDRITIEIGGALGDLIAEELTAKAVEVLANQAATRLVLLDIRELTDFTVMARVGLGTCQKLLRRRQIRTAWLVSTPRQHGLATLVAHNAADDGAGVFQTMQQVEAWFASKEGRLEGIIRRAKRLT